MIWGQGWVVDQMLDSDVDYSSSPPKERVYHMNETSIKILKEKVGYWRKSSLKPSSKKICMMHTWMHKSIGLCSKYHSQSDLITVKTLTFGKTTSNLERSVIKMLRYNNWKSSHSPSCQISLQRRILIVKQNHLNKHWSLDFLNRKVLNFICFHFVWWRC